MSRRTIVTTITSLSFVGLTAFALGFAPAAAAPTTRSGSWLPPLLVSVQRSTRTVPLDGALLAQAEAQLQARAQAELAAKWYAAVAAANALPPRHTNVNWDRIARCETNGRWSMRGARFSGGVGFANSTWNAFGGRQFAPNAGLASRDQQIVVAERVYDRYGLSGWGCRRFG